jgi:hypothetical protein
MQMQYDHAERINGANIKTYVKQLQETDLTRPFNYSEEQSLQGFKEVTERYLEIMKARKLIYESDGLSKLDCEIQISCLEQTLHLLNSYYEGDFYYKYLREAPDIKRVLSEKCTKNIEKE